MQFSDLNLDKTYTYADYLLWELKERVELIKGRLFKMSPAPSMQHQRVSRRLSTIVFNNFQEHQCEAFSAPFDVRLPKKNPENDKIYTVVQPDICVICDKSKLDKRGCIGAPDLVVEILSPGNSSKEMNEKFEVYEEAGVKEYWLVDYADKHIIVYILQDGKFIGLRPFTEGNPFISHIFPELQFDLKPIFEED